MVVELAGQGGPPVRLSQPEHRPMPEHVVDGDQPARGHPRHQGLVVGDVLALLGVDEGEVEERPHGEMGERLQRRAQAQLDAVGQPRALPVAARHRGPLLAHVAAEQPSPGWQPLGDAEG